jgi:hypothetical protein
MEMIRPCQHEKLAGGAQTRSAVSQKLNSAMAPIGIDIGKKLVYIVGHDQRGGLGVQ